MKSKSKRFYRLLFSLLAVMLLAGSCWLLADAPFAQATNGEEAETEEEEEHDLNYYREQQKEIEAQLEESKAAISEMRGRINNLELAVYELEAELVALHEQIVLSEEAVAVAKAVVADYQQQLLNAEARMKERQQLLMDRLVALYIYGDIDMLDVALGAGSFQDFLTIYDMTSMIMDQDSDLLEQIREEIDNIDYLNSQAEAALMEEQALQKQLLAQEQELADTKASYDSALAEAQASMDILKDNESVLAKAAEDLVSIIRDLLANSNQQITFGGELIWPLPSSWTYISSPYGYRTHPIYGDWRFHSGIDIPANAGVHIYSAADGQIILRQELSGYGNTVMVDHGGGVVTLYAHMSGYADFQVGDYVVCGDTIGYVGTTGASTGNHLHFEVRVNGHYTDPWNYLE